MIERKATNVTWHGGAVTRADRERIHGHRGVLVWMTGLSGSGKSTLCRSVEEGLAARGCFAYVLDGDNLRHGLNQDLTFSAEDRRENIRRVGEVGKLFVDAGAITLTAFISPYREDRARVRALLATEDFLEVYVATPLEVCEQRDPKGLYRKARQGVVTDMTGVAASAPYEAPEAAELVVDTSDEPAYESAARVIALLEHRGVIPARS